MAEANDHDVRLRRRMLRMRSGQHTPDVNVNVVQLTMKDGVEIIALEKEAFDAAFGGKENLHKEMTRETADYIEVP